MGFQGVKNELAENGLDLTPLQFGLLILIPGIAITAGIALGGNYPAALVVALIVLFLAYREFRDIPRMREVKTAAKKLGFDFRANGSTTLEMVFRKKWSLIPGEFSPYNEIRGTKGNFKFHLFDARPIRLLLGEASTLAMFLGSSLGPVLLFFKSFTKKSAISVGLLDIPGNYPRLRITEESRVDKAGQSLGVEDINFDSLRFSERYKVSADSREFAYAFFTPRMIEYFLEMEDWFTRSHRQGVVSKSLQEETLSFELNGDKMAFLFPAALRPELILEGLTRMEGILERMERYLQEDHATFRSQGVNSGSSFSCPHCQSPMRFIQEYHDSFCDRCQSYLSEIKR